MKSNIECKPRQSNLELLRIVAMIFIIMGHFITQSPICTLEHASFSTINLILGSALRIAANVFIIIAAWFLVDRPFRAERTVKIYVETAFYCIPLTLAMLCTGHIETPRPLLQGLLPFFGRPVWFVSAYLSLLVLAPFLNCAFALREKAQSALVLSLFVLYCIVSAIPSSTSLDYIADSTWFFVVYLIVGWMKHRKIHERIRLRWSLLGLSMFIYGVLCILKHDPATAGAACYWLDNIKCLPNFLCAFSLFLFFLKLDLGTCRFINAVARPMLAVYIIHQTPAFERFEWDFLIRITDLLHRSAEVYALLVPATALVLLFVYGALDSIRSRFVEPLYMKTRPVRLAIRLLDRLIPERFCEQRPNNPKAPRAAAKYAILSRMENNA